MKQFKAMTIALTMLDKALNKPTVLSIHTCKKLEAIELVKTEIVNLVNNETLHFVEKTDKLEEARSLLRTLESSVCNDLTRILYEAA